MDNPQLFHSFFTNSTNHANFYTLVECLLSGFTPVYKARSQQSGKFVTIITNSDIDTEEEKAGILEEIGILTTTHHPNIVAFVDAFYHNECVWKVLEFIDGISLDRLATKAMLQENHIAHISSKIAKALSYLHGLNRIHRDIKAQNILLSIDGEVKLSM